MNDDEDEEAAAAIPRRRPLLTVTLLDSSARTAYDPLVVNIVEELSSAVEENESYLKDRACLELEGRIGVILDGSERLRLPSRSEAILYKEYPYQFSAGVSGESFNKIRRHLEGLLKVSTPSSAAAAGQDDPTFLATQDDIFEVLPEELRDAGGPDFDNAVNGRLQTPPTVRVSHRMTEAGVARGSKPLELIHKTHYKNVDVHTGAKRDDIFDCGDNAQTRQDFRIAINVEHSLSSSLRLSAHRFQRKRERVSYPVAGRLRVDTTRVITVDMARATPSNSCQYEIEVEANGKLLYDEIKKRQRGEDSALFFLVHEFVAVVRGLVALLNRKDKSGGDRVVGGGAVAAFSGGRTSIKRMTEWDRLEEVVPEEAVLQRYLKYVSPVMPLIGDYLYRAVSEGRVAGGSPPITDVDIAKSRRMQLTAQEVVLLQTKRNEARQNEAQHFARQDVN